MNHIDFDITCRRCGGSLAWVNGASSSAMEAVAVMACQPCRAAYSIKVQMIDLQAENQYRTLERQRNIETRRQLEAVAS